MVRLPAGFHKQAAGRGGSALAWVPGYRGSGARPITPPSLTRYRGKITGVPLVGGQAQATAAGTSLTLQVGPQGAGTVWYPTQITVSTSIGQFDSAVATIYLGPSATPATQVGIVASGNGVAALAIPNMTPGQTILVTWTGATVGSVLAFNIIGTMDALTSS